MLNKVRPHLPKKSTPKRLQPFDEQDLNYFDDFNAKSVEGKLEDFLEVIREDRLMNTFISSGFVRGMRYNVRDWQYMLKVIAKELALKDAPNP